MNLFKSFLGRSMALLGALLVVGCTSMSPEDKKTIYDTGVAHGVAGCFVTCYNGPGIYTNPTTGLSIECQGVVKEQQDEEKPVDNRNRT